MAVRKREETDRIMHGSVDQTRIPSRIDMLNLAQLREYIAQWNSNTAAPPSTQDLVLDEWANEHSVPPLVLAEGARPEYDFNAVHAAATVMVERAMQIPETVPQFSGQDKPDEEAAIAQMEDEDIDEEIESGTVCLAAATAAAAAARK